MRMALQIIRTITEIKFEDKLSELQVSRQDPESPGLTQEQEKELTNFLEEKVKIRKDLRSVQFELRRNIKRLEAWIKFINIGLIPLVFGLTATGVWIWRRKRKHKV